MKQRPKKKVIKIKETKIWFLEKINKIDRPLKNLTKIKREKNPNEKLKKGDNNKHHRNPGNLHGKIIQEKSQKSSESTLRTYIPINLKILGNEQIYRYL
jgi:hypothetical protein